MNTWLLTALTAGGFCVFGFNLVEQQEQQEALRSELATANEKIANLEGSLQSTNRELALAKSELTLINEDTIPKIREATALVEDFLGQGAQVTGADGIKIINRPNQVTDLSAVRLKPERPQYDYGSGQ